MVDLSQVGVSFLPFPIGHPPLFGNRHHLTHLYLEDDVDRFLQNLQWHYNSENFSRASKSGSKSVCLSYNPNTDLSKENFSFVIQVTGRKIYSHILSLEMLKKQLHVPGIT